MVDRTPRHVKDRSHLVSWKLPLPTNAHMDLYLSSFGPSSRMTMERLTLALVYQSSTTSPGSNEAMMTVIESEARRWKQSTSQPWSRLDSTVVWIGLSRVEGHFSSDGSASELKTCRQSRHLASGFPCVYRPVYKITQMRSSTCTILSPSLNRALTRDSS
jgi:hypothetical protein